MIDEGRQDVEEEVESCEAEAAADAEDLSTRLSVLLQSIQLVEGLNYSVVWPLLPYMMDGFGYPDEEIGSRVGVVGGAFFAGVLVSSVPWGVFADRFGRRPTLLLGLFGSCFSMTLFAFANSFLYALIARIVAGLWNGGMLGVLKTYIADMNLKPRVETQLFAQLSVQIAIGNMIGPAYAGLLAGTFGPTFAFVPSMLTALLSFILLVCTWFILPETRKDQVVRVEEQQEGESVFRDRQVVQSCVVYGGLAMWEMGYAELLTIFAQAPTSNLGLGMSAKTLGIVLGVDGGVMGLFQYFLYARIRLYVGLFAMLLTSILINAITSPLPLVATNFSQTIPQAVILAIMVILHTSPQSAAFTTIIVHIQSIGQDKNRGKINGLGQALAALGRGLGPLVTGILWSHFNGFVPFLVVTLGILAVAAIAHNLLHLPK